MILRMMRDFDEFDGIARIFNDSDDFADDAGF